MWFQLAESAMALAAFVFLVIMIERRSRRSETRYQRAIEEAKRVADEESEKALREWAEVTPLVLFAGVVLLALVAVWFMDWQRREQAWGPLEPGILLASDNPFPWLRREVLKFEGDTVTFVFHHTGRNAILTLACDIGPARRDVWVGDRLVSVLSEEAFSAIVVADVWPRLEDYGWTLP